MEPYEKISVHCCCGASGILLQNNIFALISFVRTTPNILLVITCSFGFIRGRREGMFVGLFSGLLIECVFGGTMGFYMLIYVYLGYFSGIWHKYFDVENIIMPSLLCGISDLIYGLYIFVVRFALRNRWIWDFISARSSFRRCFIR